MVRFGLLFAITASASLLSINSGYGRCLSASTIASHTPVRASGWQSCTAQSSACKGTAVWSQKLEKEARFGSSCHAHRKTLRKPIMSEAPVLLVEDDPADVRLIQRAFGKLDKNVPMIRLTNGDDAVAYLSGLAPYDNRGAYPLRCHVPCPNVDTVHRVFPEYPAP